MESCPCTSKISANGGEGQLYTSTRKISWSAALRRLYDLAGPTTFVRPLINLRGEWSWPTQGGLSCGLRSSWNRQSRVGGPDILVVALLTRGPLRHEDFGICARLPSDSHGDVHQRVLDGWRHSRGVTTDVEVCATAQQLPTDPFFARQSCTYCFSPTREYATVRPWMFPLFCQASSSSLIRCASLRRHPKNR